MACVHSPDGDSFKNISKTDETSANFHIGRNQKPELIDAIESTHSESVQIGKTSSRTKDYKEVPSQTSIISSDCKDVTKHVSSQLALNLNMTRKIQDQSKLPVSQQDCQYHCQLCNSLLKDVKSLKYHNKSEGHLARLEEKFTNRILSNLTPPTIQQLKATTQLVEDSFQNHSACVKGQDRIRWIIIEELGKLVKHVLPDINLELFGSSAMGLALLSSNVNININIEDTETNQKEIPKILLTVLRILQENANLYYKVYADFYSPLKIPRILFYHLSSNLQCEIRVGSYAPVQLAFLLGLYRKMDPRVEKLSIAMKYWAKVFRVDNHLFGHYPSVVYVLIVVHYLQQINPPVLPVLHEMVDLSESDEEEEFVFNQLSVVGRQWKSKNTRSLGELLYGLLKYYVCTFKMAEHVVTIRQLKPLKRHNPWGTRRLAVEDPIIIKSNIARAAGSDKVFEFLLSSLKCTLLHILQVKPKLDILIREISEGTVAMMADQLLEGLQQDEEMDEEGDDKTTEDSVVKTDEVEESVKMEELRNGVRNVTEEILKVVESKKSKKDKKIEQEIAQLMTALDNIQLKDDVRSHLLQDMDFDALFKNYPIACLLCKRAKHSAMDCPDENVPKLQREPPIPLWKSLECIDRVMFTYANDVMLQPREEKQRSEMRDEILHDVKPLYPKATLELFGSSANGFGIFSSDLDLCLLMNETYECEKSEIIEKIAKSMKKNPRYNRVIPVLTARVPIVKLSINKWNIDCDISMENCLALQNTKMLATYAGIDVRVRVLGYFVKCFAKVCDMCDAATGSLSSYAYILMLIHYLQQVKPPVLPVLQKLVTPSSNPSGPIIDSWNCYFFEPPNKSKLFEVWRNPLHNTLSPAQLWLGFIMYYTRDFDWAHQVVTIRQLEPLTKFEKWWSSKPMAIEDPFNLDHNLGQAVSGRMRTYIIMRFQKALFHHHKSKTWREIEELMDVNILCGDFKAPKFIICDKCNRRGHRSTECPNIANVPSVKKKQQVPKNQKKGSSNIEEGSGEEFESDVHVHEIQSQPQKLKKPVRSGNESLPTGNENETDGGKKEVLAGSQPVTKEKKTNEMTRSEIRAKLMEQSGGSIEELKKLKIQLRGKAYSGKGIPLDKKMLAVVSDMIKKAQKRMQQEEEEDVTMTTPDTSKLDEKLVESPSHEDVNQGERALGNSRTPSKLEQTGMTKSTNKMISRKDEVKIRVVKNPSRARPELTSKTYYSRPSTEDNRGKVSIIKSPTKLSHDTAVTKSVTTNKVSSTVPIAVPRNPRSAFDSSFQFPLGPSPPVVYNQHHSLHQVPNSPSLLPIPSPPLHIPPYITGTSPTANYPPNYPPVRYWYHQGPSPRQSPPSSSLLPSPPSSFGGMPSRMPHPLPYPPPHVVNSLYGGYPRYPPPQNTPRRSL